MSTIYEIYPISNPRKVVELCVDEDWAKRMCMLFNSGTLDHRTVYAYRETKELNGLLQAIYEGVILIMDEPIEAVSIVKDKNGFKAVEGNNDVAVVTLVIPEGRRREFRISKITLGDDFSMEDSEIRDALFDVVKRDVLSFLLEHGEVEIDMLIAIGDVQMEEEEKMEQHGENYYYER